MIDRVSSDHGHALADAYCAAGLDQHDDDGRLNYFDAHVSETVGDRTVAFIAFIYGVLDFDPLRPEDRPRPVCGELVV